MNLRSPPATAPVPSRTVWARTASLFRAIPTRQNISAPPLFPSAVVMLRGVVPRVVHRTLTKRVIIPLALKHQLVGPCLLPFRP